MARPIKETPILRGKDAKRFAEQIKKNESRKVPEAEYRRAIDNYKKIIKNARID